MFKKDPNLKPSQVQSASAVSSFRCQKDWEKIDEQASKLADRKWIANQLRAVRSSMNPMGENFEGLMGDKKDNFYVSKINDSRKKP